MNGQRVCAGTGRRLYSLVVRESSSEVSLGSNPTSATIRLDKPEQITQPLGRPRFCHCCRREADAQMSQDHSVPWGEVGSGWEACGLPT